MTGAETEAEAEARREADAQVAAFAARLAPVRGLWPDEKTFRRDVTALWMVYCNAVQEQRQDRGGDRERLARIAAFAAALSVELDAMTGAERAALAAALAPNYQAIEPRWTWPGEATRSLAIALDVAAAKEAIGRIGRAAREADAPSPPRGAARKVVAARIAEAAARVYELRTGRPPTVTNVPNSSAVRGPWPEFLAALFAALGISDSVASHARAVREKIRPKQTNYLP